MSAFNPFPFIEGAQQAGKNYTENRSLDDILKQSRQSQSQQGQEDIMAQVLQRLPPEKRPEALQYIQQRQKQIQDANTQKSYKGLAEKVEAANPGSSLHKTIADIFRSDLSPDQKQKAIKSVTETTPYKAEQQQRLALDSVLKRYNSRIKEIEAEIKNIEPSRGYQEKIAALESFKKDLQSERDQLLNFNALKPKEEAKDLVKFDSDNPEHMQIFDQIDAQFNGDREKVNEVLRKMFKI